MSKREDVIADLKAGWVTVPAMLEKTGWQGHTLRGVLSTIGSRERLKTERQRVDGVTSYRIVGEP